MSPRYRGRQAVYIGRLPDGFNPQRVWDVPPSLGDVVLYSKNLGLEDAQGVARTFNKIALQQRLVDRRWALVMRTLRNHHLGTEAAIEAAPKEVAHG